MLGNCDWKLITARSRVKCDLDVRRGIKSQGLGGEDGVIPTMVGEYRETKKNKQSGFQMNGVVEEAKLGEQSTGAAVETGVKEKVLMNESAFKKISRKKFPH